MLVISKGMKPPSGHGAGISRGLKRDQRDHLVGVGPIVTPPPILIMERVDGDLARAKSVAFPPQEERQGQRHALQLWLEGDQEGGARSRQRHRSRERAPRAAQVGARDLTARVPE